MDQTGVGNQQDSFWNIFLFVLSPLMIPMASVNPKAPMLWVKPCPGCNQTYP